MYSAYGSDAQRCSISNFPVHSRERVTSLMQETWGFSFPLERTHNHHPTEWPAKQAGWHEKEGREAP